MVYLSVFAQWATSRLWNILDLRTHLQRGGKVDIRRRSLKYTAQNQAAPEPLS